MAELPRTYSVVRQGRRCEVTVENTEALIRLRSELALLELVAARTAGEQSAVLAARADELHDADLRELGQILGDACHAANIAAIARLDTDFPTLWEELEMNVIDEESGRIMDEISAGVGPGGEADLAQPADPPGGEPEAVAAVELEPESPQGNENAVSPAASDTVEALVGQVQETADEPVDQVSDGAPESLGTPIADLLGSETTAVDTGDLSSLAAAEQAIEEQTAAVETVDSAAADRTAAEPIGGESSVAADLTVAVGLHGFDPRSESATEASAVRRPGPSAASEAVRQVTDEIEASFGRLGEFFVQRASQVWRQARQTLDEALCFADQARRVRGEAEAVLAELRNWRAEALKEADAARTDRRQTRAFLDEARGAAQRAAGKADEAAVAADRALSEANQAETYADQARRAANN